ncbi:MAG TPA: hypothetical protein VMT46_16925, partial [Anaerolineaceae bacterium]|nr:hypothetical protein [Anaerolineaceae bacterium]
FRLAVLDFRQLQEDNGHGKLACKNDFGESILLRACSFFKTYQTWDRYKMTSVFLVPNVVS